MKTKVINLKTKLTIAKFRNRIYYFFRQTSFNSQYVSFFTQLIVEGENNVVNLNKSTIINTSNRDEVKSYVELTSNSLKRFFNSNKKSIKIKKINILYIESEEQTYREVLNRTLQNKSFGFDKNDLS